LSEAVELHEEALTGKMELLGKGHYSTLFSLDSLGNVYKEQGRFAEAVDLLQSALESRMRLSGFWDLNTQTRLSQGFISALHMWPTGDWTTGYVF
jgi:Tetratricopeptide repeat